MTLKHHQLIRPFALAGTAAMIATTIALAFGAEAGLAADYQDGKGNVCEGTFSVGSCVWGTHVTGEQNVALGNLMMPELTGGKFNVALDGAALEHNTTGENNIAIGFRALASNTIGGNNVALGHSTLFANTGGHDNVATGNGALKFSTTGHDNLASGTNALLHNTEGSFNIATGTNALISNKTGVANLASGGGALEANTTGGFNVASGDQALAHNTEGSFNIATGRLALFANETGTGNIASGVEALAANTSGVNNLAIGNEGLRNTTGSSNVAFGNSAGLKLTTGSNNIDIANEGVAAEAGKIRIGTVGKQTAAFLAGVYKAASPGPLLAVKVDPNGQLVTAKSSSARFKEEVRGLGASAARVLSLRPVSYRYKRSYAHGEDQLQYGLIAEQVARMFPSLVQYEANGKPGGVYYEELPVLLLAQLQHEHAALRDTRARVGRQAHQIDQLAAQIAQLRALVLHKR